MSPVMKTVFAIAFVAGLGLAAPVMAQTTETDGQRHSPVYSGIANVLSGNNGAAPAATEDKQAPVVPARPRTREEYRAQREARKAAEEAGTDMPLPKDMFFDKETGQWKRVVRAHSGGKYTVATTCYEITHQSSGSRVFRPVNCLAGQPVTKD